MLVSAVMMPILICTNSIRYQPAVAPAPGAAVATTFTEDDRVVESSCACSVISSLDVLVQAPTSPQHSKKLLHTDSS